MKYKITYGPMPNLTAKDKDLFSRPNAQCVALFMDRLERPVIILNTVGKPMPYKVYAGTSCVVFPTY